MANNEQLKATPVMSPLGTFVWPRLNAPDTKFKPEGEYSVKLRLSEEDSAALITAYEKAAGEAFAHFKAQTEQRLAEAATGAEKGKIKKELAEFKQADRGYKPVFDDEGNETGEYEFNFKMKAQVTYKKGPKAGKTIKMRPDIFDAKGKKLEVVPEIWGGTTGYVAGEFSPFYTAKAGAGVSLKLKGVQLIKVHSGGSGRDAAGYGFGSHEGGFEGSDEAATGADEAGDEETEGAPTGGPVDF